MKKVIKRWILPLILSILFSIIIFLLIKNNIFRINGDSMYPTVRGGDVVFVKKINKINIGDLVMVSNPLQTKNTDMSKFLSLKRCVGLPGDSIQIYQKRLYRNGILQKSDYCSFYKKVRIFSKEEIELAKNHYKIISDSSYLINSLVIVPEQEMKKISEEGKLKHISDDIISKDLHDYCLFPYSHVVNWNRDYYGPLLIPKKGLNIKLSVFNYVYYKFLIDNFENHKIEYKNNKFYVDGVLSENYTFKNDYYFVLNDFRDNPSDSRTFGPVPKNHIYATAKRFITKTNSEGSSIFSKTLSVIE
ncbi:MAG: signal peptidase I [Bacteroidales bacterium]|nr:signal peptidase I [Bacteroidales bacterium]